MYSMGFGERVDEVQLGQLHVCIIDACHEEGHGVFVSVIYT